MTEDRYTFYPDLAAQATEVSRGIHSQTLAKSPEFELVLFAMAGGESLSEHTAAKPAIVHVLGGEGELVVEGERHELSVGAWLSMPARTRHAIVARTGLVFALYLMPAGSSEA